MSKDFSVHESENCIFVVCDENKEVVNDGKKIADILITLLELMKVSFSISCFSSITSHSSD